MVVHGKLLYLNNAFKHFMTNKSNLKGNIWAIGSFSYLREREKKEKEKKNVYNSWLWFRLAKSFRMMVLYKSSHDLIVDAASN